ncbi:MAG: HAD-IIB family hydrolase [Clostridia bacterium]|nr:HAD-IIB family hydrolase [Clostridia bacterium]
MKKMIASDYDRTFYLNDEDIEENKKAVEEFRKNGNIFVIATGRSFYHFMKIVKKYKINYDYAIINHGATIIDSHNNVLYNKPMENSVIKKIKDDLQLNKATDSFCCSKLDTKVDFEHKDLTKINVKYKTKNESLKMNEHINKKYSDYVTSYNITSSSIEIISNKTNKSKTIKLLADKLNVDINNVYTIGDGYSDIKMVKDFNGYCMKDSVKELKNIAKGECTSVSELLYKIS